jgi:hypothetical protein
VTRHGNASRWQPYLLVRHPHSPPRQEAAARFTWLMLAVLVGTGVVVAVPVVVWANAAPVSALPPACHPTGYRGNASCVVWVDEQRWIDDVGLQVVGGNLRSPFAPRVRGRQLVRFPMASVVLFVLLAVAVGWQVRTVRRELLRGQLPGFDDYRPR